MTTSQYLRHAVETSQGDLAEALAILARCPGSAYGIARKRAAQFFQGAKVAATRCEWEPQSGAFLVSTPEISWAKSGEMHRATQPHNVWDGTKWVWVIPQVAA
jgi:hypothetical protein